MIEIDLRKLERGIRTGTVVVRRGGKIFQRKQRLGQKEREEDKHLAPKSDVFPNVGDTIIRNGKKRVVEAVNKPENSIKTVGGGWCDWDRIASGKVYKKPKPKPEPKLKPIPVRTFPNAKEYKTIINDTTKKFDKILNEPGGKTFIGSISKFIGHTEGVKTLNPKWGKDTQQLRDDFDKLNNLFGDNYDVDVDIEALPWGERSYEQGTKTIHINVNSESRDRFLFHEIGHVIENQGENSDVASWFVQSRTEGEEPCKLCDLFPSVGYGNDEITCKDHFIEPYIGKVCPGNATEALSMGLERFVGGDLAENFYYRDKEHFMFTLAIMAGKFIKGVE